MLTEKRMFLAKCCKAYGMDKVAVIQLLNTEELQDKMLEWMKDHTTASPEEVLRSARKMRGFT